MANVVLKSQLYLTKFLDPSTPSMRKVDDGKNYTVWLYAVQGGDVMFRRVILVFRRPVS